MTELKTFFWFAIVVVLFFWFLRQSGYTQQPQQCPPGSYPIGLEKDQMICKLEPTGCPYGDSIPMEDCDKHKPQPKPQVKAKKEVFIPPPQYVGVGK
jgi:hypothetical protein